MTDHEVCRGDGTVVAGLAVGGPLALVGVLILINCSRITRADERDCRAIFDRFNPSERGKPFQNDSKTNILICGLVLLVGGLGLIIAAAMGLFG